MMRVLFLDIDGVVLSGNELWGRGDPKYLPPAKLALVKEVCDRAGAVIVVSSTWRYSEETRDMLLHAGLALHRDWRTPHKQDKIGSIIQGCRRGAEIQHWLDEHPEISGYAIVDDDSDMEPQQMSHFVKTPHADGIDREHVEQLVAILRQPPLGER